mmetsp:Transcript_25311/g.64991  ORF Transcript_25311/g.64991 Transcript_25311/m.64991 type:complete len:501 (+) Transcript_25311:42-1544(+)
MYGGYPYGAPQPPSRERQGGYGGMRPMGLHSGALRGVPMPYGMPEVFASPPPPPPPVYAPSKPVSFDSRMSADTIEEEIRLRQERIRLLDMQVKEREIMELERKEQALRQQAEQRRRVDLWQPQVRERSRSPRRPPVATGLGHTRSRRPAAKPAAPAPSPRSSPTPESYFKAAGSSVVLSGKAPAAPRAGSALERAAAAQELAEAPATGASRRRARAAAWAAAQQDPPERQVTLRSAPGREVDALRPGLVLAPRGAGDRLPRAPAAQGPAQSKLLLEPATRARPVLEVVKGKPKNTADKPGNLKLKRGVAMKGNELAIDYSGSDLSSMEKATGAHDSMVKVFESMGMEPEGDAEHSASVVDLSRCQLGDEALEMFLQTLVSFKVRPRVLKLFRNQIGNAGMDALSEFVLHTPTAIEEFHLSHNKISEDGVTDVLSTMQKHEAYMALSRPAWFRVEHNEIQDSRELLRFLREDLGVEYRLSEKPSWKQDKNDFTLVTLFPI